MPARTSLVEASEILLDQGSAPGMLLEVTRQLHREFATITGLGDQAVGPGEDTGTRLSSGLAIAPVDAGRCLVDFARTTTFVRAIHDAIGDLQDRFGGRPIEILYAGCGPYATLALPAMAVTAPGGLQVTLLDLHPRSLESVRALVDHYGLAAQVRDIVQVDATRHQATVRPQLVIVETMQRALEKEPQLAICAHLAPQLDPEGILIPERITVSACAVDLEAEFRVAPASELPQNPRRRRVELATLVELTAANAPGAAERLLEPIRVKVPGLDPQTSWRLMLRTAIEVYAGHRLGDYDSGITCPAVLHAVGHLTGGEALEFRYRSGPDPGFECQAGRSLELRRVEDADLELFFVHLQDPVAAVMAAFVAPDRSDRAAFDARWARIRADAAFTTRTILSSGKVAGHVASFAREGQLEVTYWVDRKVWGRGIASGALELFLGEMRVRPLHARAAADNTASIRVLEKCGFIRTGTEAGFAAARGEQIEELLLRLDGPQEPRV